MKIFIETERCQLREITEADAIDLYELDSDPEVHKYLGNRPVKSIAESRKIIAHIRKQYQENGIGRWAIIEKVTQEFVGWSGLKYEQNLRENLPYYDIGYRLKRKYWGQGIAKETALASLQYGFNQLHILEICAAAHTENAASNKILTSIGLKWVETFELDGAWHNWYKLERSTWEEEDR